MTSIDRHPGPERYDLMREKTVEQKLVKAVKNRGGICPKLVCPGFDGMPVLDVAWGYECYQNALKQGIGTSLNLWDTPFLA